MHRGKTPQKTQSMKIQVESGKNQSARTLEKLCKTLSVTHLHLNQPSLHVIQYSKLSHNKHGKRSGDIKTQI